MNTKRICCILFVASLALFALGIRPVAAQGDRVIPHVPDGRGSDGTAYRTKFDLTNLGPDSSTPITKTKLMFFHQDGTPWTVATNLGTAAEFPLNLGAFQTIRVETLGTGSLSSGYAIVRNLETLCIDQNSPCGVTIYAEDFQLNISVFYEVKKGNDVIDTVSVAVGQPTVVWVHPVETDASGNLLTGFAIVNLTGSANGVTLQLFKASGPSSGAGVDSGTVKLSLLANEQRALFFNDKTLFPNVTSFKGMVLGYSDGPVAILALLQSPTPTGVQYATMVPTYADALRRNTYIYLREQFPLDADLGISDYYYNAKDTAPWDILLEKTSGGRQLTPQGGAQIAPVGKLSDVQFDAYSITQMQGLSYSTTPIDMSNSSSNLTLGYTFAVKTGLGRYVKLHVGDVIQRGDTVRDLVLEMFAFK